MTPTWVDEVMPFRGPCGLCGGPDARHRTLDAIKERVVAGDSAESVAEDYGYSLSFVERVVAEWDDQSNEAEEPPVSTTENIINEIAEERRRQIEVNNGWQLHAHSTEPTP